MMSLRYSYNYTAFASPANASWDLIPAVIHQICTVSNVLYLNSPFMLPSCYYDLPKPE